MAMRNPSPSFNASSLLYIFYERKEGGRYINYFCIQSGTTYQQGWIDGIGGCSAGQPGIKFISQQIHRVGNLHSKAQVIPASLYSPMQIC